MKKLIIFLLPALFISSILNGQNIGFNLDGSDPDPSAILDLKSSDKGLLVPRLTQTQRNAILLPSTGLMIYQTDGMPGFYYYNGTVWMSVGGNTNNLWSLSGNAGINPNINFIGTTDNQPLIFKFNNEIAGQLNNTNNTAFGRGALLNNTISGANTAFGINALRLNTTGQGNSAIGIGALNQNTSGVQNTALGSGALTYNTTGNANTATGAGALLLNTTGFGNTSNGINSLLSNTTGNQNTSYGGGAVNFTTTGNDNTGLGYGSLTSNTIGSQNTGIGSGTNVSTNNLNNATAIGYGAVVDASNKVRIGNAAVTIIEGQVPFTTPSDGRYKYDVQDDVKGLDFILKLRPVTYQFDAKKLDSEMQPDRLKNLSYAMQASYKEAASIRRTGFIAQEVEKAAIETRFNFSGIIKPQSAKDHYSLSYESFVVPLVKAIQEQQIQIEELKKENEELKRVKDELGALKKIAEKLSDNK